MGKASRWIRNLLIGKKEEKTNNKSIIQDLTPLSQSQSQSERRRWSFRRSNNSEKVFINHKSCQSFDSIVASQLVSQALFDYGYAIQHQPPPPKANSFTKTLIVYRGGSHIVAVASATKIQAAFRSYLARKALCALRGLVKLQALVRGHLVRKRTTTMIRCMKALVSIQVRARYQRIQLAIEDAESLSLTKTGSMMAHKRRLGAPQHENNCPLYISCGPWVYAQPALLGTALEAVNNPSNKLSQDYNETIGHFGSKSNTCFGYRQSSRRFSIDSTHDKSMRLHDKIIDEVSIGSQMNTQKAEPNYMTRTKSSRARARSHSEPRQRPTKQNRGNRQNESPRAFRKGVQTHARQKDQEAWLAKLHTSSKSSNDFDFDSAGTCTNRSSYHTALYAYEVRK